MWILIIFLLWANPNLYAANPYKLGELDYFHRETKKQEMSEQEKHFDWREASVGSDGRIMEYTPPKFVLALLETPTPENAKAYLAWQRQKAQKIIKAQEAIDQVMKEEKQ